MRGRLASGILKRIGLSELVAATESEYVDRVVKIAQDPAYRTKIRQHIAASRAVLFNDVSSVRALESFLLDTADPRRATMQH